MQLTMVIDTKLQFFVDPEKKNFVRKITGSLFVLGQQMKTQILETTVLNLNHSALTQSRTRTQRTEVQDSEQLHLHNAPKTL